MPETKKIDVKVYAVGTCNGKSVLFALVNREKWIFPTDLKTMSLLAQKGIPVRNE